MSDAKTVVNAVVHDVRAESRLNNPDFKRIARMFADAFEVMAEEFSGHSPGAPGPAAIHPGAPGPPPLRVRKKSHAKKSEIPDTP